VPGQTAAGDPLLDLSAAVPPGEPGRRGSRAASGAVRSPGTAQPPAMSRVCG